jgi:hypothetical protein
MRICVLLIILVTCSCGGSPLPEGYLSSETAPSFGSIVEEHTISNFLDSAGVPKSLRFFPVMDSLPNRTYFFPTGLLFKRQGTLINERLCNAHYKNISGTISYLDRPKRHLGSYSLQSELLAIKNLDIDQLPNTDYYLILYWSLSRDNLNERHFKNLQRSLQDDNLSLTILYVNVDNREEYNLTPEEYKSFLKNNRRQIDLNDTRWLQN